MACIVARTTAAPVMSLFISSIELLGLRQRPPESKVTPLPTRASVGPSPPWRYSSTTNAGGASDPAATPSTPPNRSCRIRSSSQTVTSTPATEPERRASWARWAGGFSAGGRFARSRARLIAVPTTSPRRTASRRSTTGTRSGSATTCKVPNGWRPGSDLRRSGPRVPTITPSVSADAMVRGSPDSGRATATESLGLPASRRATAAPAAHAAPASNRSRGPRPNRSTDRAGSPACPSSGVVSPSPPGTSFPASRRPTRSPSGAPSIEAGGSTCPSKRPRASQSASTASSGWLIGWTSMAGSARGSGRSGRSFSPCPIFSAPTGRAKPPCRELGDAVGSATAPLNSGSGSAIPIRPPCIPGSARVFRWRGPTACAGRATAGVGPWPGHRGSGRPRERRAKDGQARWASTSDRTAGDRSRRPRRPERLRRAPVHAPHQPARGTGHRQRRGDRADPRLAELHLLRRPRDHPHARRLPDPDRHPADQGALVGQPPHRVLHREPHPVHVPRRARVHLPDGVVEHPGHERPARARPGPPGAGAGEPASAPPRHPRLARVPMIAPGPLNRRCRLFYSGLPMSCTQTGVLEPADDVLGGHSPQRLAQRLIEPGLRPRLGPSEPLLDLREHLLDRRVIRAVRRQRPHSRPHPLDRRGHSGGQVGLQVVQHHHVARVSSRHQHLVHVRLERCRVGGSRERQRGANPVPPQRRDQRHRLPRGGRRGDGPLAARRPGVGRGHLRGDPRLVPENQVFRLDLPDLAPKRAPLLLHLGPVPLAGVPALLLAGQASMAQGEPQGLQAAGEAASLPQLLQRGVGLLADQVGEALLVVGPQGRGRAATVGLGGERPGAAPPLEQADDEGGAEAEGPCDLADRTLVMFDRRRDALAEVHRIGAHSRYLLPLLAPHPEIPLPRKLFACAIRW